MKLKSDLMELKLKRSEIYALHRVVQQYWNDELTHYSASVFDSDKPDEHIWNDLFILNTALNHVRCPDDIT